MRAFWSVLPCLAGAAAATAAAPEARRFEGVRELIRSALVERSVPSVAVAVAKDGRILWEEGFGWADRERRVPATAHTMYSVASISKPITATGLMTLVQAGRIDLDRPANDYLGAVKLRARVGDASQATVRRVANHTSGLPVHYQFYYADEPFHRPSMDETLLRYGNLVIPPGERFVYSNLGYGVLDSIIARVSGASYAEFMRREVFIPLGLTRTSVDIGPGLEAYAATRYGEDGLPIPFYDFDHPGASAVFSSAHDLARFGLFHLKAHLRDQQAILSDEAIDEMHRSTSGGDPNRDASYGFGFFVGDDSGYRTVAHGGGMGGVSTNLTLFPDERLAVVVLSNANSSLTREVYERIVAAMLPRWRRWEPTAPAQASSAQVQTQVPGEWRGMLSTPEKDVPLRLQFLPGGEVHAQLAEQLPALVADPHWDGGVFTGELFSRIGTPDTERYDYSIHLDLTLRGDVLNGAASATGVAGPRVRNSLAHWVELRKVDPPR